MDILAVAIIGTCSIADLYAKTKYINIVMYITMPIPPRVVMTELEIIVEYRLKFQFLLQNYHMISNNKLYLDACVGVCVWCVCVCVCGCVCVCVDIFLDLQQCNKPHSHPNN